MTSFGRSPRIGGLHNDNLDRLQTSYQEFHDDESDEESSAPPQFQQTYQNTRGGDVAQSPGLFGRPGLYSPKTPKGRLGEDGDKRVYTEDSPMGGHGSVIIHHVPEPSKSRWSHIEDLDSFFKKVYEYHQRHGFTVMMLQVK